MVNVGEQTGHLRRVHEEIRVMSRFCMVLANLNKSEQYDENHSKTGSNMPANHLPSS